MDVRTFFFFFFFFFSQIPIKKRKKEKKSPQRTVIFKTHFQAHHSIPFQLNPISKILCGCACGGSDLKNLTFSIYSSVYHFQKKSTQSFYHNLLKIHPICIIWAPLSLMKNPPITIHFVPSRTPKAFTYAYNKSL